MLNANGVVPRATQAERKKTMTETIALTTRDHSEGHDENHPMKLSTFQALLETHRDKLFHLVLPSQRTIPVSFHITEVAYVQKKFIDCGGALHTTHTCQLQVWMGTDTAHRLLAGKMANVLNLAEKILPTEMDLDIEIEYEDTLISQYPVLSHTITESAVVLSLGYKHTDCLAKDRCLPSLPMVQGEAAAGCCGTTGCC